MFSKSQLGRPANLEYPRREVVRRPWTQISDSDRLVIHFSRSRPVEIRRLFEAQAPLCMLGALLTTPAPPSLHTLTRSVYSRPICHVRNYWFWTVLFDLDLFDIMECSGSPDSIAVLYCLAVWLNSSISPCTLSALGRRQTVPTPPPVEISTDPLPS